MSDHGLRTPSEEITFTARPKIKYQFQMFRYGRSIFCLLHQPKFSDFFSQVYLLLRHPLRCISPNFQISLAKSTCFWDTLYVQGNVHKICQQFFLYFYTPSPKLAVFDTYAIAYFDQFLTPAPLNCWPIIWMTLILDEIMYLGFEKEFQYHVLL